MKHHYVWLLWSSAFLVPWALIYFTWPSLRQHMLRVSVATSLLGLTEPIFVPAYWSPPSLFELAQRTRFDIESLVFSFAIGGIGVALYNALMRRDLRFLPAATRHGRRHRLHAIALMTPYVAFPLLYVLPWNPIYPAIAALAIGAASNVVCRPDLGRETLAGGLLFLVLYAGFMASLVVFTPGYIERVWNLRELSGLLVWGIPMEELAFGFAFGAYWAGLYEHFTWRRSAAAASLGGAHA